MNNAHYRAVTSMLVALLIMAIIGPVWGSSAVCAGQSWALLGSCGLGDTNNNFGSSLIVYEDELVVGTHNPNGAEVLKRGGNTWTQINNPGFGDANCVFITGLAEFKGDLYASTTSVGGPLVVRYDGGKEWTTIAEASTFAAAPMDSSHALASGGGYLFLGGEVTSGSGTHSVIWSYDGKSWNVMLPGTSYGGHPTSMKVIDGMLYACIGRTVIKASLNGTSGGTPDTFSTYVTVPTTESLNVLCEGPEGRLALGTSSNTEASLWEVTAAKEVNKIRDISGTGGFTRVSTLFWDGGAHYIFTVHKESAFGVDAFVEVWQMDTDGNNAAKIAKDGFGNDDNIEVTAVAATFGSAGAGPGTAGEQPNYFAATTNWVTGLEVYGTELEKPTPSWYFAEGYTGPGFTEYLTIQNPGATEADVVIEYMLNDEENPPAQTLTVPATTRSTVNVNEVIGPDHEVSAKVTTTNETLVIVERPLYFDYGDGDAEGGHVVVGVNEPSDTWYFAEGYTGDGFDEYITLLNPVNEAAEVELEFFGDTGDKLGSVDCLVPGHARRTVHVNDYFSDIELSTQISSTNGIPVVAERPIYAQLDSALPANGGTCQFGLPEPEPWFFFGEGYTAPGWNEYLLLWNPSHDETMNAFLDFLVEEPGGQGAVSKTVSVEPRARKTIIVNDHVPPGSELGLAVTSDEPFIAERAMYFDYQIEPPGLPRTSLTGAHAVFGRDYAKEFLFAEGYTGTWFDEYLTIANPNDFEITVTTEFMLEGGGNPAPVDVKVPAKSRETVRTKDYVAENKSVSARLTSNDYFIAERPMYFWYKEKLGGGDCVMGYTP